MLVQHMRSSNPLPEMRMRNNAQQHARCALFWQHFFLQLHAFNAITLFIHGLFCVTVGSPLLTQVAERHRYAGNPITYKNYTIYLLICRTSHSSTFVFV